MTDSLQFLDFEEKAVLLEKKIKEMRHYAEEQGVECAQELETLEQKCSEMWKNIFDNLTPWQRIRLSRHPLRPQSRDYIEALFEDFFECHGDRRFSEDPAIVGGFAFFRGHPVCILGHHKGRDVDERLLCHFGMAHPEGYRKADRLIRLAEKRSLPVIQLIDTPGAYPGIEAEERGQAVAIAESLFLRSTLRVPLIAVVIGEGGSGGALAFGLSDVVGIMENAYYSIISPEGCASILWKDVSQVSEASEALRVMPSDLISFGVVDHIIKEPLGGAHRNKDQAIESLGDFLEKELKKISQVPLDRLIQDRYDKFRALGEVING